MTFCQCFVIFIFFLESGLAISSQNGPINSIVQIKSSSYSCGPPTDTPRSTMPTGLSFPPLTPLLMVRLGRGPLPASRYLQQRTRKGKKKSGLKRDILQCETNKSLNQIRSFSLNQVFLLHEKTQRRGCCPG